jgi:hypothetical protein
MRLKSSDRSSGSLSRRFFPGALPRSLLLKSSKFPQTILLAFKGVSLFGNKLFNKWIETSDIRRDSSRTESVRLIKNPTMLLSIYPGAAPVVRVVLLSSSSTCGNL